jgi:hypothetical protein
MNSLERIKLYDLNTKVYNLQNEKKINNEIILMQNEDHLSKTIEIQTTYDKKIMNYEEIIKILLSR